MCTSFVFNGKDTVVASNFEGEGMVSKLIVKPNYIAIAVQKKNKWVPMVGVNSDGTFVSLLTVKGVPEGEYRRGKGLTKLGDLAEKLITGELSFLEAKKVIKGEIINDEGSSFQLMATDTRGNIMMVEPGRGAEVRKDKYGIAANFSYFDVAGTKEEKHSGYDRYLTAVQTLSHVGEGYSEKDALGLLRKIDALNKKTSKFSFIFSVAKNSLMIITDSDYAHPKIVRFPKKK